MLQGTGSEHAPLCSTQGDLGDRTSRGQANPESAPPFTYSYTAPHAHYEKPPALDRLPHRNIIDTFRKRPFSRRQALGQGTQFAKAEFQAGLCASPAQSKQVGFFILSKLWHHKP